MQDEDVTQEMVDEAVNRIWGEKKPVITGDLSVQISDYLLTLDLTRPLAWHVAQGLAHNLSEVLQ